MENIIEKILHRIACRKMAVLLSKQKDERIKQIIWNKFKKL